MQRRSFLARLAGVVIAPFLLKTYAPKLITLGPARAMTLTLADPPTGMAFRVITEYIVHPDPMPARVDVLYGYGRLRPEAVCRVWE